MLENRLVSMVNKLSKEFNKISDDSTEAYIAVGMITEKMFDFAFRRLSGKEQFRIVVGVHMPTPPDVMEKLFTLDLVGNLSAKVFTGRFFHPKLYLFRISVRWVAFVGSGNFTNGGWHANEELFVKVTEQKTCEELFEQFCNWESASRVISSDFLTAYKAQFEKNEPLEAQKRKNAVDLVDKLESNFNIDNVDFSAQFFKKTDFMTFHPTKVNLDTQDVWKERAAVRNQLYKLNDQVTRLFPESLEIYPHYIKKYIASQIETVHHDDGRVESLWVGYGRNEKGLKMYGVHKTTPLYFMRMQFIIHHDSVGFWLMPGKAGAGEVDRGYFAEKMRTDDYRIKFFNLLTSLGDSYWIDIAGINRKVTSFKDSDELASFVKRDALHHYFIIGRNYKIDDQKLSVSNIAKTCVEEFTRYYPLYRLILHHL